MSPAVSTDRDAQGSHAANRWTHSTLGTHDKVVHVHPGHDLVQVLGRVLTQRSDLVGEVSVVECRDQSQACLEDSLRERLLH
jgi:hypothetical protein